MKRKNNLLKPIIASILAVLGSFSVGFASWSIVEIANLNNVAISGANVEINENEFIYPSNSTFQKSIEYNVKYGFLYDEVYGDKCEMITSFYLDVAAAKSAHYVIDDSIKIDCVLTCEADKTNNLHFISETSSATDAQLSVFYATGSTAPSTIANQITDYTIDQTERSFTALLNINLAGINSVNLHIRYRFMFEFPGLVKPMIDGALATNPQFKMTLKAEK